MLVSERIGQFFVESDGGRDRLEYTEYGSGDEWVVLLHGLLMPRRMQQPLARAMAAQGLHVVTLDLLGHGRSDQPADPLVYSMTSFGEQVVALLDHLGAEQAVIGGTSLGANVSLEVAVIAPERVKGLIVEMPVLNNALVAGILAFVPIMLAARYLPITANTLQRLSRSVPRGIVPFWVGIGLDTVDHRAESIASVLHGVIFGRLAPSAQPASSDPGTGLPRRPPDRPDPPLRRRRHAGRGAAQRPASSGPPRSSSGGSGRSGSPPPPPTSPSSAGTSTPPRPRPRRRPAPGNADAAPRPYAPEQARWGRMTACPSTATRRSCSAPTSWVRPTASSPC